MDVFGVLRRWRAGAFHVVLDEDQVIDTASLPPATEPTGAELVPASQSSAGVAFTTDQLATNPGDFFLGLDRTRWRDFEDFESFSTTITATGVLVAAGNRWGVELSGTGAQVVQAHASDFLPGIASVETGTLAAGRCAVKPFSIVSWNYQQTEKGWFACRGKIVTLSDATNQFEVRLGLISSFAAAPTDGLFFRATHANTVGGTGHWEAVNMDDTSNITAADTGVAIDTNYHEFAIYHDGATAHYYIDGAEVATQSTNRPDNATGLIPGAGIFKGASTTSRQFRVDFIEADIPCTTFRAAGAVTTKTR